MLRIFGVGRQVSLANRQCLQSNLGIVHLLNHTHIFHFLFDAPDQCRWCRVDK